MSEMSVPQPQEAAIVNPSIKKAMPDTGALGGGDALKSVVGNTERQVFLERFKNSEHKGGIGVIEDAIRFMGNELGLSQDSRELGALKKFLKEKGAKEGFQAIVGREMTGKTPEEQAEFMSVGMESLKEVVSDLMEVKQQASELNSEVVANGLSELWDKFINGSEEDRKAISTFFAESKKAKKESWDSMMAMWDVQEDLDSVHKVKEIVSIGEDIPEEDEYDFSMHGGLLRKVTSFIKRLPGGAAKRVGAPLERTGKRAKSEVQDRLIELRTKALSVGNDGEDVKMWANGIISRRELGDVEMSDEELRSLGLNDEQVSAFTDKKDLNEFSRNGKFVRASESKQTDFMQGFFGNRVKRAENSFNEAREKYLGFDVKNASNWDKLITGAAVPVDVVLPKWFKSGVVQTLATTKDGVLTMGEGVGKGVGFTIDHMESNIAGGALENLSSTVVAREMAVEKLAALLDSEDGVDDQKVVKAAAVLRGAETALARAALFAGRADDTVSMAEGKNLAISTLIAPGELIAAGLNEVTGGILAGEKTRKVFAEIFKRTKNLLDGDGALKNTTAEFNGDGKKRQELALSARGIESNWIGYKQQEMAIPRAYQDKMSMADFINNKLFAGKLVEGLRKKISSDSSQDSELWQVIAGGSKRQSVEEVNEKTENRRAISTMAIEFVKEKLKDETSGSERADMLIKEATLITLRDAQRKFTESELKQVSQRAKLDKMWSDVFGLGAGAVTMAVAALAFTGLESIAGGWVDQAGASLGRATGELQKMNEGLQKVIELATQNNLPTAVTGAKWDIFWQNSEVMSQTANLNMAEFVQDKAPLVKLLSLAALAVSPAVVAARNIFELLPGRAKVNTEFMATEKVK